jgi:chemotaxis protein MotB
MTAQKIKIKLVEDGVDGAPPWITTFVDMTSLLVTFFILLFTFSSIRDFEAFTYPLNIAGTSGIRTKSPAESIDAPRDDVMSAVDIQRGARDPHSRPADQLPDSIDDMGQALTEQHLETDLNRVKDGLRVRFDPAAVFRPGSTEVNAHLRKSLRELGDAAEHYSHVVVIEGYTDSAFRPTPEFPTSRDLGLARARAAARVLLDESHVSSLRVQLVGVGDRPLPGNTNDSPFARAANRRVEVRIMALDEALAKRLAHEEARR